MEEVDEGRVGEEEKRAEVTEEMRKYVEESRRRREKLKLEILASLSKVKKAEEMHGMGKARRNTLDVTMMAVMDVGREEEVDVRGMTKRDGLKLRFVHSLANVKMEEEMKVRQKEEIEKMREVQEKVRKEKKRLEETLRLVKLKNRRLSRYLQLLQTRLVASTLALNYQMSRKVELTRHLALLTYYRDISLENSFAYLYGQLPNEPAPFPLGGVFSPYAYTDYNEEEERLEKEYTYLTTLCPPAFRASAQQRRVSMRAALLQCFQVVSPFIQNNHKPASIEYASLEKFSFFSAEDAASHQLHHHYGHTGAATGAGTSAGGGGGGGSSPQVPHLIPLRSSSSSLNNASAAGGAGSGHPSPADHHGSGRNSTDEFHDPSTSSSSHSKRSIKALKPSLSDRPTKHEIDQTSPRRSNAPQTSSSSGAGGGGGSSSGAGNNSGGLGGIGSGILSLFKGKSNTNVHKSD